MAMPTTMAMSVFGIPTVAKTTVMAAKGKATAVPTTKKTELSIAVMAVAATIVPTIATAVRTMVTAVPTMATAAPPMTASAEKR